MGGKKEDEGNINVFNKHTAKVSRVSIRVSENLCEWKAIVHGLQQ